MEMFFLNGKVFCESGRAEKDLNAEKPPEPKNCLNEKPFGEPETVFCEFGEGFLLIGNFISGRPVVPGTDDAKCRHGELWRHAMSHRYVTVSAHCFASFHASSSVCMRRGTADPAFLLFPY